MAVAATGRRASACTENRFILALKKAPLLSLLLLAFFCVLFQSPFSFAQTSAIIAAGDSHSCARLSDGTVKCWGYNGAGQLGDGTSATSYTPVAVTGMTTATEVAAAALGHTCARLSDGTVKCWGANASGQLGDGTTIGSSTAVVVSGITTATVIATGHAHSCASLSDGTVKCWGANASGQLGDGTFTNSSTPVTVSGISTATSVAAGVKHTCARLSEGAVKCWGDGADGRLGHGAISGSNLPVAASGISSATTVTAGYSHTCAVLSDGTAKCWGRNSSGQLGNGTAISSSTPVTVSGISTATAVAGGASHSCARLAEGAVKCWGALLGNGAGSTSYTPVAVSGITTATAIATGNLFSCASLSDGAVKCWGNNGSGQLGDGTNTSSTTPVTVNGINTGSSNPTLTLTKSGTGTGTVTSNPAGIHCGATCAASYASGTSVTLTAAADAGSTFAGFSGGCTGATTTCSFTLTANTTVTATFNTIAAPTSLSAIDRPADEGGAVDLAWTPSTATGIIEQRLYRATTSGGPYTLAATMNNNTVNTHTDSGLTNGTTYYYVVRAFDGTTESADSNQAGAAAVDNMVPLAPTQLIATDYTGDQGGAINLSWSPSTSLDVTQQRLYRATDSGGPYTLLFTIPENTTSRYTDQAATANTTYY